MDKNKLWDKLLDMGISEQTLRVVTNINGFSEETLNDILYSEFGYRDMEQVEGEEEE
jgi:hypothetical protein